MNFTLNNLHNRILCTISVLIVFLLSNYVFSLSSTSKPKVKYQKVTFKGVSGYIYPTDPIPDNIKALHGKRIRIKGFAFPKDRLKNLSNFFLMDGSGEYCCEGRQVQVNELIEVNLKKPIVNLKLQNKIEIRGILVVGEKFDEYGEIYTLYTITDAEIVKSKKKASKAKNDKVSEDTSTENNKENE